MMIAAVINEYGPASSVFEYRDDVPKPKISRPNEILVKNYRASVNPADCKQRSGNLQLVLKHKFPLILSQDFAGVIVEVGSDISEKFKVGDEVFGCTAPRNGCAAEFVVAFESELTHKPKNITWDQAAAAPTGFCTAWRGLFDKNYGNLAFLNLFTDSTPEECPKENVLILGASGSVGSSAVQLASRIGQANVYGICGERNIAYVESIGAIKAYSYESDFATALKSMKFDLILDCVGGDSYYHACYSLLNNKRQGRDNEKASYVTCVGPVLHGGSKAITVGTIFSTIKVLAPRMLNDAIFGTSRYKMYLSFTTGNGILAKVAKALEKELIAPRIDPLSPLPLQKINEAHEKVEKGTSDGKLIVRIVENEEEK